MVRKISDFDGVGKATLTKLKKAGVESIDDLARADPELLEDHGISRKKGERLTREARQQGVIIQSGSEVVDEYNSRDKVTTGVDALDEILDGGWEQGFVGAIAGQSGTAKTQLAFNSLVHAVEQTGKPAVYIETERGRYRPERLQQLSNKEDTQDKIYRVPITDLDGQELAYDKVRDTFDELSLVVIDSFTARFRLSDEFDDRSTLTKRSAVMSHHLSKLEKLADELEIPILLTAQVYGNPNAFSSSEAIYGGSLMLHTIGAVLYMKKSSGDLIEARLENHPGLPEDSIYINVTEQELQGMSNK